MYAIGTKVYCKSLDREAVVNFRGWNMWGAKGRRAFYIVEYRDGRHLFDYMTDSKDLKRVK